MAETAALTIVPTETEAEMLCAMLRTAGIQAFQRQTNIGAGFGDGMPQIGAHEVVVASDELARAREVLAEQPEAT
jgi:putative signal transducing protein